MPKKKDKYINRKYNQYIPLKSGFFSFQFRDKWFTQQRKGTMIHPKKDTRDAIRDSLLELDRSETKSFKDKNRYDKLDKKALIKKLMDDYLEWRMCHDDELGLDGLPVNRIVYYPHNPTPINYFKVPIKGGPDAVPTAQAHTPTSFPGLPFKNIILTMNDDGSVDDEWLSLLQQEWEEGEDDDDGDGGTSQNPNNNNNNTNPDTVDTPITDSGLPSGVSHVCMSHLVMNGLGGACCEHPHGHILTSDTNLKECTVCKKQIHAACDYSFGHGLRSWDEQLIHGIGPHYSDQEMPKCFTCTFMEAKYHMLVHFQQESVQSKIKSQPKLTPDELGSKWPPLHPPDPIEVEEVEDEDGIEVDPMIKLTLNSGGKLVCCSHWIPQKATNGGSHSLYFGACCYPDSYFIGPGDLKIVCPTCKLSMHPGCYYSRDKQCFNCSPPSERNEKYFNTCLHFRIKADMPDCIAHQQLAKGLPPVHRKQWLPPGQDPGEIIHADTEKPVATTKWTPAAIAAFTGQAVTATATTQTMSSTQACAVAGGDPQESDKKPAALPAIAPAAGANNTGGGSDNAPSGGEDNGDGGTGPGGDAPGGQGPVEAGPQAQPHVVFPPIPEFIASAGAEGNSASGGLPNFALQASDALRHIQRLYQNGCFLCPGGMANLQQRRPGAPWDRSKRNEPRFQSGRTKVISYAHEAMGGAAGAPPGGAGFVQQLIGSDQNQEKWVEEAPFTWSNWVNVSADQWTLNQQYLEGVIRLLWLMKVNPPRVPWWNTDHVWGLVPKMHVPHCKHSCQIIYFAIATQTGPLFEPTSLEHRQIGHNPEKGPEWNQYEKEVATSLFHSLGVEPHPAPSFLEDMCFAQKASAKQGQDNFNGSGRATFPKSVTLYYLGMSGKPGWDARLYKIPRPGARKRNSELRSQKTSRKKKKDTEEKKASVKPPPRAMQPGSQDKDIPPGSGPV